MSRRDQDSNPTHQWQRRVKDWLIVPHTSFPNPHDVTPEELSRHHSRHDCWMAIDGVVFDVSRFILYHPGGTKVLESYAGRDATAAYQRNHAKINPFDCIECCVVGRLLAGAEGGSFALSSSSFASQSDGKSATPNAPSVPALYPIGVTSRAAASSGSFSGHRGTSSLAPVVSAGDPSDDFAPSLHTSISGAPLPADSPVRPSSGQSYHSTSSSSTTQVTTQQLSQIAVRSQLFAHHTKGTIDALAEAATQRVKTAPVEDEKALEELFVLLDKHSVGYIKRRELRDFLYKLDPEGVAEELLLKAPEQITLRVFEKIVKQL